MPQSQEAEAHRFYAQTLGLQEVEKPPSLAARGGCWFRAFDREALVAAQAALSKIKRAMPTADAERIESLLRVMTRTPQHGGVVPDSGVMLALAEAVNLRHVLGMATPWNYDSASTFGG